MRTRYPRWSSTRYACSGDSSPESCARLSYGHAVMGTWTHASGGTVVTVGCTDWACGLGVGDDDVEQVTRNLLDRLG